MENLPPLSLLSLRNEGKMAQVPPAAWGPPKPSGPFRKYTSSLQLLVFSRSSLTGACVQTAYALFGSGRIDDIDFGVFLNGASDLEIYLLLAS